MEQKGFTLLEILVSLSLGVLLFVLLLSIYILAAKSLSIVETKSELGQNARLVNERLLREIRQAKQIATILPAGKDDPLNPPKSEIEFQDGHQTATVQYIRFYLSGTDLKRQMRRYYFPAEPEVFVPHDSRDDFGNPPQVTIVSDELAGQYIQDLKFYGRDLINIELTLDKSGAPLRAYTSVYGRNL